jgi:hypothetical protein
MEIQGSYIGRVSGVFKPGNDANGVYDSLRRMGYSAEEISVVMSDTTHSTHYKDSRLDSTRDDSSHFNKDTGTVEEAESDEDSHAAGDAGRGALIGGATGAVMSIIAAVAVPGLGLALAGPLLAGLTGAAAGGVAGGAIGALVGSAYPKEHAEYYESSVKEGNILVGVNPKSQADEERILEEFTRHNGQKVYVDDSSQNGGQIFV